MGNKCVNCNNPAHEANGWVLSRRGPMVLCGICARRFAQWYKSRVRNPITKNAAEKPWLDSMPK